MTKEEKLCTDVDSISGNSFKLKPVNPSTQKNRHLLPLAFEYPPIFDPIDVRLRVLPSLDPFHLYFHLHPLRNSRY